jgi:hypothetical protein
MANEKQRVAIPATGVHVLPFLTSPAILSKQSESRFLVVETIPLENGAQTEARCQIPMTQGDAVRLAVLILNHALANNWPLPPEAPVRRTIQ